MKIYTFVHRSDYECNIECEEIEGELIQENDEYILLNVNGQRKAFFKKDLDVPYEATYHKNVRNKVLKMESVKNDKATKALFAKAVAEFYEKVLTELEDVKLNYNNIKASMEILYGEDW